MLQKNFGSVGIPVGMVPPKPVFLEGVIEGERYGVGSGPVLVMDRRTLKVYGFTFRGADAPGDALLPFPAAPLLTRR